MNISLKQLKAFLGVASANSFTKTAQDLHVSQAALSAIIRELETQLRCRLFERTTRSVLLTDAGKMFYPTAVKVLETLEKSTLELNELGRQTQARLSIGCTPILAASLMPMVLQRFMELYPQSEVELIDAPPGELQRMVEDGDLDAAFGSFFSRLSGLDRHPVFQSQMMAVSAAGDAQIGARSQAGKLHWRDLEDTQLICMPKDSPLQRLIETSLAKEDVAPGKRTGVSSLLTAIAMAQAGFGTAILPSFCEHISQLYQVRLDKLRPTVEFSFYQITRAGRINLAMLEQFTAILVACMPEAATPPAA